MTKATKALRVPFGLLTEDEWDGKDEKELPEMPKKKRAAATRVLAGEVDPAAVREETYQGRTHIVIPVVALIEGVLRPVNSEGPELVLASEFSQVPEGWNGRPVMMNHPAEGDVRVSANSPKVLEAFGLGTVFNAKITNGKLVMEAWIDQGRVALVEGAADIAARLKKTPPELVDVSVGVFVSAEMKAGTHNGAEYSAVWRDIVPDHLAILPAGTPGACSVEMGCGLPRAAAKETKMTLRERFAALLAAFKPAQSTDMSDADIRSALDSVLFASVPGFIGIDAVFEDRVIYAVAPPVGDSMMAPFGALPKFQRSYTIENGVATLGLDTVEVQQTTSYEPVGTPPPAPVAAAGCGCTGGKKNAARGEQMPKPKVAAGGRSARIQAVVDRVTAVAPELMGADAVTALTEWSDEELVALEALAAMLEKAPPAEGTPTEEPVVDGGNPPPAVPAAAAAEGGEMTKEEFLASAPEPFKSILMEHEAAAVAKHASLVDSLKAAQSAYSETELKAMSAPQLEKVAKLVAASRPKTDFSPLAPAGAPEGSDEKVPAPLDMNSRIRVARGIEKAS